MRQREREPAMGLDRNPRPSRGRCLSPRLTASHFRLFQVSGKICPLQHGAEAQHMFSFSISAVCFAATSVPSKEPVDVGEEAKKSANQTPPPQALHRHYSPLTAHQLIYVSLHCQQWQDVSKRFWEGRIGRRSFFGADWFFFFLLCQSRTWLVQMWSAVCLRWGFHPAVLKKRGEKGRDGDDEHSAEHPRSKSENRLIYILFQSWQQ